MKKLILFSTILSFVACSGRFVKKNELVWLKKSYKGQFSLKKEIDIGNNESLPAGSRVRLYFRSSSKNIRVYAYKFNEPRESAIGKNILYLFESDFEDEEYNRRVFLGKLNELIAKVGQ